jgi:hypothetical protein
MRTFVFFLLWVVSLAAVAEQESVDLQSLYQEMLSLRAEVTALRREVTTLRSAQSSTQFSTQSSTTVSVPRNTATLVDLSEQDVDLDVDTQHILSRPWWLNVEVYGFAAAGYYDTGEDATRDHGGFEIKESSLFVEADVWDDVGFFVELQTNRLGADDSKFVRTGEVYMHFRDIASSNIGVKVGRIDLPFGEEYLWQDAIDNPLITNSASYPYGWDEGVLVYGSARYFDWVVSVTDGTDARSIEDNSDKAYSVKVSRDLAADWYTSASYLHNGDNVKSAIEFGGSHFQPVQSDAGSSPSSEVSSDLFEVNVKRSFMVNEHAAYASMTLGYARQDDDARGFDRDLRWFSVEPYLQLNPNWYAVVRYSEIGTYDDSRGFHFDGKTFAGGNSAFGYDVRRFQRTAFGIGWKPNPNMVSKLEIGKDRFDLIDSSVLTDFNDRYFIGLETAIGF